MVLPSRYAIESREGKKKRTLSFAPNSPNQLVIRSDKNKAHKKHANILRSATFAPRHQLSIINRDVHRPFRPSQNLEIHLGSPTLLSSTSMNGSTVRLADEFNIKRLLHRRLVVLTNESIRLWIMR